MEETKLTKKRLDPSLSVIMSVYNCEEFLRKSIDSILNQTFTDFEFIIINDGSTDKSKSIIESYNDSRIKLVNQKNRGLVESLNRGIKLSRAKIIARMDADDISLPERLTKEYQWIEKDTNRALVSTFFEHIEHKTGMSTGTKIIFPVNDIDLKRALYFTNPFAHGAAMYRKDAINEVGLYSSNYSPTEDYELWRRLAKEYEVGMIPEVLFQYRINNPASESQAKNALQTKFIAKIQDEIWHDTFYDKSIVKIVRDYKKINTDVYGTFTAHVKDVYVSHQFTISKFSFLRGYFFRGLNVIIALFFIKPKHALLLFEYIPKGMYMAIKRLR